ncbi:hypothetical protein WD019_16130 [Fictibacillus sp. Mic-4]|uniref:hypothetical protein n=1 Tax=Fictibacillus TaxID=1329200 RepID=UPI000424362E|nr:hypothetical protein [Fictibacillus gelatini]
MEVNLTAEEVITQIKQLDRNGESLKKKQVKESHPELMRSALYYYPSWQDAIERSGVS